MNLICALSKRLCIFFCLAGSLLSAQQSKVDSLQKLIASGNDDTVQVRRLNILSCNQKSLGQYEDARESATRALTLARTLNFKRGIGNSYSMIGISYMQQGQRIKALDYFILGLDIARELGDKKALAQAYNNIGLIHFEMGNYGKALENYDLAVKLNKETGNKQWLTRNYNNIGNIYADKKNNELALENYFLAKEMKEELNETKDPQYANIIANIGSVYFSMRQYEKSLTLSNEALKIRQSIDDINGIAASHIAIGAIFFEQMKLEKDTLRRRLLYETTLQNYVASRKIGEDIQDEFGIALANLNLGSLFFTYRQTAQARNVLLLAYDVLKKIRANDVNKDVSLLLAQCDSADGNWKGAYEYERLYKQYSDSIFSEENTKKLAEMATRFETEKKEARITQLEKERKRTILHVSLFVSLVLGLLFVGKRAYDNKKKVAEFMKTENDRKEVLIQEVHHRINNNLQIISSLLSLQASTAGDERLISYLKESQNRIHSLSSLHELLYQTDASLKVNMQDYFNKILDFQKEILTSLPGKVELNADVANIAFGTRTAVPLALILNELLTNSVKYAFPENKGGQINISLQPVEGNADIWLLKVSDSGKGLGEGQTKKNNLGLRLVNIMTKQIHGRLNISNSPGATFDISFSPINS